MKPLGKKSYGSIPHLPGSKLGPGDHHCHEGQGRIATEKTRDKHDFVIVQEKYDGSNVAVANVGGNIIALTRSGYLAETSPFEQHHVFARWVKKNVHRFEFILPGERLCGEWLLQAHGLKYGIPDEPFVAFDYFRDNKRLVYGEFVKLVGPFDFSTPQVVLFGHSAFSVDAATERLFSNPTRWITSVEQPEGLIYRVERKGEVDFLCKWVRPDFIPGKYLPEISGSAAVFNFSESSL